MNNRDKKFKLNPDYKSFAEAREFARLLGLKSKQNWDGYIRGKRPDLPVCPLDILSHPGIFYRYHGWSGFADFLDYPSGRQSRNFKDARIFARSLKLSSFLEWRRYCKGEIANRGIIPKDIPPAPHHAYRNHGWMSWPDFLGNGMVEHNGKLYKQFERARKFARARRLKNPDQWFAYCNGENFPRMKARPDSIPVFPHLVYKHHGWSSWADWLGTIGIKGLIKYRDFTSAREFVQGLKLKNHEEWKKYCRGEMFYRPPKPDDIPQSPNVVFKNSGWTSWGDFLGTKNIASSRYVARPFEQARSYVWKLGFKNEGEWRQYCKGELPGLPPKPDDIPTNPHRSYRSEWRGMGDWLGSGVIANKDKTFRSFAQAWKFVHKLKLKNTKEWRLYCLGKIPEKGKRPEDIPGVPDTYYKNWISYGDWLGTGNVHSSRIRRMSYEEARDFVRSVGIKTCIEWRKYVKGELPGFPPKPLELSSNIDRYFKGKGWVSWRSFLGTEKPTLNSPCVLEA